MIPYRIRLWIAIAGEIFVVAACLINLPIYAYKGEWWWSIYFGVLLVVGIRMLVRETKELRNHGRSTVEH